MLARIAHWQAALLEPAAPRGEAYTLAAIGMFHGEEEEEEVVLEEDDVAEGEEGGPNGPNGTPAASTAPAAMEEDGAAAAEAEAEAVDHLPLYPWGAGDIFGDAAARMAVLRLPERKSFHIILHRALAFLVREAVKNPGLVGPAGQGELERLVAHLRERPRVALGLVEVRGAACLGASVCMMCGLGCTGVFRWVHSDGRLTCRFLPIKNSCR